MTGHVNFVTWLVNIDSCVLISFKGKACHLGFGGKFSSVITDLSETLSSNNDKCIIWWYSSENYSHRSQNMAKIWPKSQKIHRHGDIMDAIYAISTSSRANQVRINILKVEISSFKTLAYRALTDQKNSKNHKKTIGTGTLWMRFTPSALRAGPLW